MCLSLLYKKLDKNIKYVSIVGNQLFQKGARFPDNNLLNKINEYITRLWWRPPRVGVRRHPLVFYSLLLREACLEGYVLELN